MKSLLLLFTLFLIGESIAQDTLSAVQRWDKSYTYLIKNNTDTFFIHTYPSGKLESRISYNSQKKPRSYRRYYEDGTLMWHKILIGNYSNGSAYFYSRKGEKVAEFIYKNDTIIDMPFISKKHHFIHGRITHNSVVYGGMMREDGSSNISRSSGPNMHFTMYTVKLDTTKETQEKYANIRSDFNGYYFLILEKGNFGIYPNNLKIESVDPKSNFGLQHISKGIDGGWTHTNPIIIDENCYNLLNLHYSTVGYAP